MNYMKQVAQMLGVEIGEDFMIVDTADNYHFSSIHRFKEDGLYYRVSQVATERKAAVDLYNLLNGNYDIIKMPKPALTDDEKEYLSRVIKPFIVEAIEATADSILIKIAIYKPVLNDCSAPRNMKFDNYYITAIPKTDLMPFNGLYENKEYTVEELDLLD